MMDACAIVREHIEFPDIFASPGLLGSVERRREGSPAWYAGGASDCFQKGFGDEFHQCAIVSGLFVDCDDDELAARAEFDVDFDALNHLYEAGLLGPYEPDKEVLEASLLLDRSYSAPSADDIICCCSAVLNVGVGGYCFFVFPESKLIAFLGDEETAFGFVFYGDDPSMLNRQRARIRGAFDEPDFRVVV